MDEVTMMLITFMADRTRPSRARNVNDAMFRIDYSIDTKHNRQPLSSETMVDNTSNPNDIALHLIGEMADEGHANGQTKPITSLRNDPP